jgi:hypothetical protein
MKSTRREFLRSASLLGAAAVVSPRKAWSRFSDPAYFGLHEFVEAHPDAVFILRTSVDVKTDATAIKQAAYDLGKTLFVPRATPDNAFPLNTDVVFKPNVTSWSWDKKPVDTVMGIQTDPSFIEGLMGSLTDLSVPHEHLHIREANYFPTAVDGAWYSALSQGTGIDFPGLDVLANLPPEAVVWSDVTDGVWFSRIPHLAPVNAPGSCLLNVAKLKSHSMGMTLCSKNLQGTVARPYVAHCSALTTNSTMPGVAAADIVPGASDLIQANYRRHRDAGIPRWSTLDGDPGAGSAGGLWMETHSSRCLDNNSTLNPLLNIIEGIYGREGPFVSGPGPGGYGVDMMVNLVIFGKNARHCDIIGAYLAGHEPGNFGLFHLARERGLSTYLNPHDVPLYEWTLDGSAVLTDLSSFPRTPIGTLYLRQAGEDQYHMVDQPFDYATASVDVPRQDRREPDAFIVEQNFPNPFNPSTSIQFFLPRAGDVRLEIFDIHGQIVDVLVDQFMPAGEHLQVWKSSGRASGTYFYRLSYKGMKKTKAMVLLR